MKIRILFQVMMLSGILSLSACGGGSSGGGEETNSTEGGSGETASVPSSSHYVPKLADDLTIQLAVDEQHPLQLPNRSAVMEVDLFDTPDVDISKIKAQSKLLCYFSAGSYEDWRADKDQFPAEIIGNDYDGWPSEKWVDIRSDALKPILQARLDRAVARGCDGVDPDNVNGYQNNTGFLITAEDQLAFNRWLAEQAHQRGLFIALKNEGSQAVKLVNDFDAVVSEQCFVYQECSLFDPFIQQNKPVWDIEYTNDTIDYSDGNQWNNFCQQSNQAKRHGYWLPDNLDGRFRHSCQVSEQVWNDLSVGFGGGSSVKFARQGGGAVYVSAKDWILNPNMDQVTRYQSIQQFDANAFKATQAQLSKSDWVVMWATKNWQPYWFDVNELTALSQAGKGLVFNYWYFGDHLMEGLPDAAGRAAYLQNVAQFGEFLAQIPGSKWVNFEPEFNKDSVLDTATHQQQFIDLMRSAIDILKAKDNSVFVSLTMMDRGRRNQADTDATCGYKNCALGDKSAWAETQTIYQALLPKLDYLSFQNMVGQFSRNPLNPGSWDSPNPIAYKDAEIGIDDLAQRLANFAQYLSQAYHKPVMLPYLAIATATWQDSDGNGVVDTNEVNPSGWEDKLVQIYQDLKSVEIQEQLKQSQFMGLAAMELVDNPQHDAGGYRFFMQNEDCLGLLKTSARPDVDPAAFGDVQPKHNAGGISILDAMF